ncbi:Uncharacterised protein [Enterobacter hormaechei]|nr:Uncharacterised protein [Enterobacter hormaechei]
MPVLRFIASGIDVAAVESANVAFIAHIRKLLTNIVCREHLGWGSGHTARKDRRNMPRLHTGYFTVRWIFCLSRKDKANAERQGNESVAHCGKHSESLKTEQNFNPHSMKL